MAIPHPNKHVSVFELQRNVIKPLPRHATTIQTPLEAIATTVMDLHN
jgi:hypothetical protein